MRSGIFFLTEKFHDPTSRFLPLRLRKTKTSLRFPQYAKIVHMHDFWVMAGAGGIEPPLTRLECVVLPLNYAPVVRTIP